MQLIFSKENISIGPKMSLVQAPMPTPETLSNDARTLEPSANSSGDAVDEREKATETTENEETMEILEQEINDLLDDNTSEECNVNKELIIDTKDEKNESNKEENEVTPDKESGKDEADDKIHEIMALENKKVKEDNDNFNEIPNDLNKITDTHTPANLEDGKVECTKENDVELNCINNDTEEDPVNVQQSKNKINDLESSNVSQKEVESNEINSVSLDQEISTPVTDLGQDSENIDDIAQSISPMEQDTVNREVGKKSESDSGKINCDPVVNGINKDIEPLSSVLYAGEQSEEIEKNINTTDSNDESVNIDDLDKSLDTMEQDIVNKEMGKKSEPHTGKTNCDPVVNDLVTNDVDSMEIALHEEEQSKDNEKAIDESKNIDDVEKPVDSMEQDIENKEMGNKSEYDTGKPNCDPVVNDVTKDVDPMEISLGEENQSKENEKGNDESKYIDDVEISVDIMDQDIENKEIGKKSEPDTGKSNCDPVVNDVAKDVDTMEIVFDEEEQSKMDENVNVTETNNGSAIDSFNEHIEAETRETVAESYEESVEDFINATDVKEDVNLDIALNEINDAFYKASDTNNDKLANEIVSQAATPVCEPVTKEDTVNLDTSSEKNTDITLTENIAAVKEHNVIANVNDNVDKDNEDESHEGNNETTITDEETNAVKIDIPNKDNAKKDRKSRKTTSYLDNNLDIFSDEEDDTPTPLRTQTEENKETIQEKPLSSVQDKIISAANNKIAQDEGKKEQAKDCVSLVDDEDDNDDVMVIDENNSSKSDKPMEVTHTETKLGKTAECTTNEDKLISDNDDDDVVMSTDVSEKAATEEEESVKDLEAIKGQTITEPESEAKKFDDKPLIAINFLKSLKTKMNEMTRTDLEEFCLLKIVEGVVDRSSLSEIKAKLKTMVQNVEEWRKKAMVLNKQNRDLQIVLRTVQEEQKKKLDEIITPLKITRSVGMQVLMTENKTDSLNRTRGQKRTLPTSQPAGTPPQRNSQKITQPAKAIKTPIPVPRLVPAQNSSPTKPGNPRSSPQIQNSTVSSNSGGKTATPNGVRTYTPTKSAEKRSYSVSIDLTDDEPPPAKQLATSKAIQNPVRLVPSQQLLAPTHRASLVTQNNTKNSNPRQVYIPIGGPQGNMRPGQTIVFKNSPNVRARQPAPGTIVRPNQTGIRATVPRSQNKHPAPLPQAYSQPQPPNWKALPPAPDLKISKIENGIVVSWKIDGYQESTYEEIVSYQLYAYQETSAPASTFLWNKIGDIKALPLPMACTLTQFIAGYKYYFAVRAVDIRSRIGPFSLPGSILLLNK